MKNRSERLISFLVVWLTMFSFLAGHAQTSSVKSLKKEFLLQNATGETFIQPYKGLPVTAAATAWTAHSVQEKGPALSAGTIRYAASVWRSGDAYAQPADLYYRQSGFFCKREWDLEKSTHIAFRFRLGSLADCNAMEGKH